LLVVDSLGLEDAECSTFDVKAAVEKLNSQIPQNNQSSSNCAKFTMNAVDKGYCDKSSVGHRKTHAYQFGELLTSRGFSEVSTSEDVAGDIIVFNKGEGAYSSGHMEMFNGSEWVSDFKQASKYPSQNDRNWRNLGYKRYRHKSVPTPPCDPKPDRPWMDYGKFGDFL
jgi:hypothetical protein